LLTAIFQRDKAALALPGSPAKNSNEPRELAPLLRLSSVGLEMGVAVAVGWGSGYWLDKRFGTSPWLMITFLLFGVIAGFRGMVRAAREAARSRS
jgi:ATP synthase protein I